MAGNRTLTAPPRAPRFVATLEGADAKQMLKLYEAIEDHDDVQNVYANFDIDENEM